ncbi:uncharacterized protein LOC119371737 isoform X1 [Rhipicephalus sanguineus]|nr:uncharacterized protein LOC119371737 isoform X1 [Rhipicephalus sanguineus]
MSNAGSVASRGRGRGRGRLRPSQTIETPNSSTRAGNAAKPNGAVMDQNASCTAASSTPTCNSAYDKLAHKRLDPKYGGGGDAATIAVLNKRHTGPAIRQPGRAQSNWWDRASDVQNAVVSNRKSPCVANTSSSGSASGNRQSNLPGRGRDAPRHASHEEHDRQQRRPVAGRPRKDFAYGGTDTANAMPSSSSRPGTKPFATSSKSWKSPPSIHEARHGQPSIASVAAGTGHLYALHLHNNCPNLPPVEDIVKHLQQIQILFQCAGLSMEMPCSMTDTEPCWILNNLRTFNRILMRVDIELKEEEPRKLCVCSLNEAVVANSDADGLFDACILFHLLLKRHKCIQTLHLDKTVVASGYPQILCDALACNRGLRHLAIACWDFLPSTERTLVYSLCKMPALETIGIFKLSVGPSAATRIGDMIARAKCVHNVKFLENDMSPEAGTELMKGLCRNSTLELIWLDDNALGIGGARFLGEYLAMSSKLRDLSLSDVPCFDEQQLVFIAEGLKTNCSLEKLKIHGCHVTPAGIDRLAEVLKSNTTLKHLTVSSCNLAQAETKSLAILLEFNAGLLEVDLRDNLINDFGAVRLAQALKFNMHLETLNLEANHINSQGVVSLVEALASNNVLKELRLGCFEAEDEEDERAVTTALNRIAAHGRVRLCYDMLSGVLQLSESLRMNADRITSVHLDASVDLDSDCLKDLFVALASVPCLKSLCIESQTNMDGSAARRFAKLLSTTKTLKHIQINSCNADNVALETVMRGLKKNQSVLHMEMEFSAISSSCTDAFVEMLKGNKTLTHFGYLTTKLSELYVIARELPANRVLTSLKIWERPGFQDVVFEINEILRRNVSYLNRAVEFALAPEKFGIRRHPAAIFEELCDTESFQNHLARVAGPRGASEAMHNARRYITTHLFAIAGVCQVPVTCWPHPEGARQIDCLDMLCWLNIFAHLKVTDIPRSSMES